MTYKPQFFVFQYALAIKSVSLLIATVSKAAGRFLSVPGNPWQIAIARQALAYACECAQGVFLSLHLVAKKPAT